MGHNGGMSTRTTLAPAPVESPAPQLDDGHDSEDRHAHYVRKDKIVESAVTGVPVTALCGKTWQPSRDPTGLPVCPVCKELMALASDLSS